MIKIDYEIIPRLYFKYGKSNKNLLVKFLQRKMICFELGNDEFIELHSILDETFQKILEDPRGVAVNFDTACKPEKVTGLVFYKEITYLVKSSSRFMLKADIGEIADQLDTADLFNQKIKAIVIGTEHELLPGTDGEHFIMKAYLYINQ